MMAHHEQLGVTSLHRPSEKLERLPIEPSGPWFQIVFEGEPKVRKHLNFSVVRAPQVYNVGYSEGFQLPHVGLGLDCASEREPFAHEESLHRPGPLPIPKRPRRLENL